MFGSVEKWAGMVERQTPRSQKPLPERACGFESRSRHIFRVANKGVLTSGRVSGHSTMWAELRPQGTSFNLYARPYLRESRFVGDGCNTPSMYNQATRDRTLALIGDGLSVRAISQITGVSRATLKDWREHPRRPRLPSSCVRCAAEPLPPEP